VQKNIDRAEWRHFAQIRARGEIARPTREHHRAKIVVGYGDRQLGGDLGERLRAQGIARVGTIERDPDHTRRRPVDENVLRSDSRCGFAHPLDSTLGKLRPV
jgi:hypothetical protein